MSRKKSRVGHHDDMSKKNRSIPGGVGHKPGTGRRTRLEAVFWLRCFGRLEKRTSAGADRAVGIGPDGFFGEKKMAAFEGQDPAQQGRPDASQDAQDLQGLE
jgi:hypothetical protein